MSKAHIKCGQCGNEWTYSGLSCESCFCPACDNKIMLERHNPDGSCVEIERKFGFADRSPT